MAKNLTTDLYWFDECIDLHPRQKHMHDSAYLLENDGRAIMIDTGAAHHRDSIMRRTDAVTNGQGVEAMIISKSHEPHAANLDAFKAEWDDPEIIASSGVPIMYGIPEATKAESGKSMTIAGRGLEFIDPPLLDVAHSTWIYDARTGALFTADGFGHYHDPGDCDRSSDELPDGIDPQNVLGFHKDMLLWLTLINPDRLIEAVRSLFETYDVNLIAPIHGNPIISADINAYLDTLEESIRTITG